MKYPYFYRFFTYSMKRDNAYALFIELQVSCLYGEI